jgi:hypothetical protein
MWECEWERLKKQDPELKAFVKDMQRPCDRYSTMREDSILQTIMDEKLFGALAVDLHVPDDLKSKFAEMTSVIFVDVLLTIPCLRYTYLSSTF